MRNYACSLILFISCLGANALASEPDDLRGMVDRTIARTDKMLEVFGCSRDKVISFKEYADLIRADLEGGELKGELETVRSPAALSSDENAQVLGNLKRIAQASRARLNKRATEDASFRALLNESSFTAKSVDVGGVKFESMEFIGSFPSNWGPEYRLNKWLGRVEGSGIAMIVDSNDRELGHGT